MFQIPLVKTDDKYRERLVEIHFRESLPEEWKDSHIESLCDYDRAQ